MKIQEDLKTFISRVSELWNSKDFDNVLKEVKQQLAVRAIPVNEWENRKDTNDGAGIYCFWYLGEKLEFGKFKKSYLEKSKGLSISKPYKKWYNKDVKPVLIADDTVKAYSFYLGKRESVLNRISQHIGIISSSKSTYGMHLSRHEELKKHLYVGYWLLPELDSNSLTSVDNKYGKHVLQQVLTFLETELRNELAPWVGKQ